VNYRIDPGTIQRQLPSPFRPKLQGGHAVAGICLIRLEHIRPIHVPNAFGLSSENAAHRIAVTWDDDAGTHEGVYIPRRDTSSMINRIAGGRLFPGEYNPATFDVVDEDDHIRFRMESKDRSVRVDLSAKLSATLPQDSCFASIEEASRFFERGSVGYSATAGKQKLDGMRLKTDEWKVEPLEVEHVFSSYFADSSLFSPGSAAFDCALIMRNIHHEWQAERELHVAAED
jgi:hypothetical protein